MAQESPYRRISCQMWADVRFRSLSQDAQFLWLYLLTGLHTTSLPGLFRLSMATAGDDLGWSPRRLRKRLSELLSGGMIHRDEAARVTWIPNCIKYNPPHNANAVKSWGKHFALVPECELKHKAWAAFKRFAEPFAGPFAERLPEPLTERFDERLGEPIGERVFTQDQEQEQEQHQEQDQDQQQQQQQQQVKREKTPSLSPPSEPRPSAAETADPQTEWLDVVPDKAAPSSKRGEHPGFSEFWAAYPRKVGKGAAHVKWNAKRPDLKVCLYTLAWQVQFDDWVKDGGEFIPHPATWLNQERWLDEPRENAVGGGTPTVRAVARIYNEAVAREEEEARGRTS